MTPAKGARPILSAPDGRSFSDIYRQYWKELCTIAAHITKDKVAAQDLVQEVFLSFLRNSLPAGGGPLHGQAGHDRVINNIHGYLVQSLKYQCFNWLRHARIAREHLARMDKAVAENTTENLVNLAFTDQEVQQIVTSLPERCREVFRLSRVNQLTNEQIAAKLNINQRTVENHLTRALRILRLSLKFSIFFLLLLR